MKRREWSPPRLSVRVHPVVYERFKEICKREGDTISNKVRKWILQYVTEHEEGNPQLRLDNLKPPSLLAQVLEVDEEFKSPTVEGRRRRLEILELNLKRYPKHPVEVAKAFMKKTGLKARTVEEYMRVLGRPVKLTPTKRRRNY